MRREHQIRLNGDELYLIGVLCRASIQHQNQKIEEYNAMLTRLEGYDHGTLVTDIEAERMACAERLRDVRALAQHLGVTHLLS